MAPAGRLCDGEGKQATCAADLVGALLLRSVCRGVVVRVRGFVVEDFGFSDADANGGVLGALAGMAA